MECASNSWFTGRESEGIVNVCPQRRRSHAALSALIESLGLQPTSRFPACLLCSAGLCYLLLSISCFVWHLPFTGLWPRLALWRKDVVVCDLSPWVRLSYACFMISQDAKARQKAQDVEDSVQEVRERGKPDEVKRRTEEMWTRARWPAWQRDETYVCRQDGEIYATATYQAFVPVHADCTWLRQYRGWPGADHRWKAVRYSFPSPSGGLVKVVVMTVP
jgi:hypothetical protein